MYTITKTFEDYNGNTVTREFRFNLTEAEIAEMDLTTEGGLEESINRIINANDIPAITKEFKKLLLKSYGEKSPDGLRFIKSDEITTAFSQTEAYSMIFMDLITDTDAASAFVNGIVPKSKEGQKTVEDHLPSKPNNNAGKAHSNN